MTEEFEMAIENARDALIEVSNESDGMRISDVVSALQGLVNEAEDMIFDLRYDIAEHAKN